MEYKLKNKLFFLIIFIGYAAKAQAQPLSVKQCIKYAMEHNVQMANQELNIELQQEDLNQSKRNLLPSITGSTQNKIMFGKSIDPSTNDFVNERFFSTNFYLGAEIDLFKGLTKKNYISFNKTKLLISSEQYHQEKINTVFSVMSNYYNTLYYKSLLMLTQEQIELSNQRLQKAKMLVNIGLKPTTEILEMEAQLVGEQHNAIHIENMLHEALLDLKNAMYYPIDEELKINDSVTMGESIVLNVDPKKLYMEALEVMPTTRIANLEIESQSRNVKIARGLLSPTLSFGASYSTYYADSRKESMGNNSDQFHTISLQDQIDQNASQNIYLSLRIPIFQKWQRMSRIQKEKIRLEMATNKYEEASLQLYKQIVLDLQQLKSLRTEIMQLEKKRNAEKQALDVVEKKLEKGIVSVLEFYTAKNNLVKTEAELLRAKTMSLVKKHTISIYTTENEL